MAKKVIEIKSGADRYALAEDITNYSYLFGRSYTEERTRFYNFKTPTTMSFMFWENDTWNDIDLSKYFSSSKGNMPTAAISVDRICYVHNTMTSFKFPSGLKINDFQSAFQGSNQSSLTIDWNGIEICDLSATAGPRFRNIFTSTAFSAMDMSGIVNSQTKPSDCYGAFNHNYYVVTYTMPPNLKVSNAYQMFYNTRKLKTVNYNGMDTSACTDFRAFHQSCWELEEFDGANLQVLGTSATLTQSMFNDCRALKKVWIPKEWVIKATTAAQSMFNGYNNTAGTLVIYTDAPETTNGGQWGTYWKGAIPDSQVVFGATHAQYESA